jgi:mannose/fructose/N-acetylgalactosamine-specific phosphotransferase system component IIC
MTPVGEPELLRVVLLGMFLALDQNTGLGLQVSQPLPAGTLAGFALGRPEAGAAAGALLQMIWPATQPVGGARLPDLASGALAAAIAVPAGFRFSGWFDSAALGWAAALGVLAAWSGGWLVRSQHRLHAWMCRDLPRRVENGDAAGIERLFRWTLLLHAARGAVLALLLALLVPALSGWMGAEWTAAPAGAIALGLGAVGLVRRAGWNHWRALVAGTAAGLCAGVLF